MVLFSLNLVFPILNAWLRNQAFQFNDNIKTCLELYNNAKALFTHFIASPAKIQNIGCTAKTFAPLSGRPSV
jgi:hypothetical protein